MAGHGGHVPSGAGPVRPVRADRGVRRAVRQTCLVLGSSTDGRVGQIIVGSTATPLLHSSEVPIAIAPRGYRAAKGSTLGRLTCSFAATADDADLLTATAQMSAAMGCPLRIVTFGVRGRTMYPPEVGLHAEDEVLQQWREQVQAEQEDGRRPGSSDLGPAARRHDHRDRHRRHLGRGHGRGRMGGSGGAGRRVVAGRAPGPGVPRVRGHQDRPVLAGPGGCRPGSGGHRSCRSSGG